MFKEVTLAITLGALLGFGLTGGYLASQKSKKTTRQPVPSPIISNTSPAPTTTTDIEDKLINDTTATKTDPQSVSSLTITSPKNEDIVANSLLEINGSTTPNSQIIINTSLKHYQTIASDNGEFKLEIELESGLNNIQVDAFDSNDNQSTTNIQVTYSTAKI